jgi:hypothetical protein
MTYKLLGTAYQTYSTRGNSYTADKYGMITVSAANAWDIADLTNDGCICLGQVQALNNLTAVIDPVPTNDSSQDYGVGSVWVNTAAGRVWICQSATANAAVWELSSQNPNNFRNVIDGGDFQTNPWQRGNSIASISNAVAYGPDRFFAIGGASSNITLAKAANTDVAGFTQACTFGRTSGNTDTAAINFGQVMESLDCYRMQGQQVTLSFWAKAGANYSGGAVTVKLFSGTNTDDTAANMVAGSWAGSATPINSTFTPNTTMTRYQFTGTVAAAAKQLGSLLSYTPTGTAGAADNIILHGIQLEVGGCASPFEFRDAEVELALAQRYFFQINEPASGVIVAAGHNSGTNTQTFVMGLPTPMRANPTVNVTVGSFKANSSTAGVVAATGLTASGTHTTSQIGLTSTGTGTAGQGATLQGGGGAGKITVSADY